MSENNTNTILFLGLGAIVLAVVGLAAISNNRLKAEDELVSMYGEEDVVSEHLGAEEYDPTPPAVAPLSTPMTLASRHGLGGAPFVGSQSTKLGGSTFLPYATLPNPHRNRVDEFRPSTKGVIVRPPPPVAKKPAAVAKKAAAAAVNPKAVPKAAPKAPSPAPKAVLKTSFFDEVGYSEVSTRDGFIVQPNV